LSLAQELENSIDIVELVSKYTKLKKAGVNYKTNCPFPGHNEKTPSFVVSPVKQIAYCFWCHRWGWPLKFLMDIENRDFKEALILLWEITGKKVEFNEKSKEEREQEKSIYQLFKDATYYYHKTLSENNEVLEYLLKRGITREDIKIFQIGYSDSANWLYRFLKERGFNDKILDESQIFTNFDGRRDKFFWRIMFPLQTLRGETVAFAGRIIHSWEPKYINSPTTSVYDKSSILYGLFQWKKEIIENDFVIICEWYMDTIALQRAGFKNTVCVSGTALTEKQIDILRRLTKKFYLCFDNDKAWENATKLSLELLKNKWVEVRIISINGGKDPDEIIKSWEDFRQYIDASISPMVFTIKRTSTTSTSIEDKRKVLKEVLPIIKSYSDQIERDLYIKEISEILNIRAEIIYDEFNKVRLWKEESWYEIKGGQYTSQEYAMAYILSNPKNKNIIQKYLIFLEHIQEDFKKVLENPENIDSFPLEKKERIRGLSLKLEEESSTITDEKNEEILKKTAEKVNQEIYRIQYAELKNKLASDKDAPLKLIELINTGKKFGIK
jgi:DNA primase